MSLTVEDGASFTAQAVKLEPFAESVHRAAEVASAMRQRLAYLERKSSVRAASPQKLLR